MTCYIVELLPLDSVLILKLLHAVSEFSDETGSVFSRYSLSGCSMRAESVFQPALATIPCFLRKLTCRTSDSGAECYEGDRVGHDLIRTERVQSITCQLGNRRKHIRHLRQDRVFELRCVGDESIERGDAADRSVEVFEQLTGNARRDFGAVAP